MRIEWNIFGSTLVALLATFVTLQPFSSNAQETIRIGGTGSALGTMKLIAKSFEKSHPSLKVMFVPSIGSSGAARAVAKSSLDIGLMGRPLKKEEASLGLTATAYAKTPFVPVVHDKMRLAGIINSDIESIYRGTLRTWPDGQRIRLVLRPAADFDTELVKSITPGMKSLVEAALLREGMLKAKTDQDNLNIIEKTRGAFGFSTLAQLVSENRRVRVLSLNGIRPSLESLAGGSYPLSKTFSLVTGQHPSRSVKTFCAFILSADGRAILKNTGNIPLPAEAGK